MTGSRIGRVWDRAEFVLRELPRSLRRRARPDAEECNWCFGWVSSTAREESLRLGLDQEFVVVCRACLARRAYLDPPEGWAEDEQWMFSRPKEL